MNVALALWVAVAALVPPARSASSLSSVVHVEIAPVGLVPVPVVAGNPISVTLTIDTMPAVSDASLSPPDYFTVAGVSVTDFTAKGTAGQYTATATTTDPLYPVNGLHVRLSLGGGAAVFDAVVHTHVLFTTVGTAGIPADTQPAYTAAADLDASGRPVLAVVVGGELRLLRYQPGDQTFAIAAPAQHGIVCVDPSCAPLFLDFDLDGDVDCLLASSAGRNLLYLNSNTAPGTFEPGAQLPDALAAANAATVHITAADFNGDGAVDFLLSTSNSVRHVQAGAGGAFADVTASHGPVVLGGDPAGAPLVFDANRDGAPDVYVSRWLGPDGRLHLNTGTGEFVVAPTSVWAHQDDTGGYQRGCTVVDPDGDGWLDVVLSSYVTVTAPQNRYMSNLGNGGVAGAVAFVDAATRADLDLTVRLTNNNGNGILAADITHDGYPEVMVTTRSYGLGVFQGLAGNRMRRTHALGLPHMDRSSKCQPLDFDADGDVDVLCLREVDTHPAVLSLSSNAHAGGPVRALRVKPLSAAGHATQYGAVVRVVRAGGAATTPWAATRAVLAAEGYRNAMPYDVHFALPDAVSTYNVEVAFPHTPTVHTAANHPALAGVVPGDYVEAATGVVRPLEVRNVPVVEVTTTTAPAAAPAVTPATPLVVHVAAAAALAPVTAVVNGVDVAASWAAAAGGYTLRYVPGPDDGGAAGGAVVGSVTLTDGQHHTPTYAVVAPAPVATRPVLAVTPPGATSATATLAVGVAVDKPVAALTYAVNGGPDVDATAALAATGGDPAGDHAGTLAIAAAQGANVVVVRATDANGWATNATFTIVVDSVPPHTTIVSELPPAVTDATDAAFLLACSEECSWEYRLGASSWLTLLAPGGGEPGNATDDGAASAPSLHTVAWLAGVPTSTAPVTAQRSVAVNASGWLHDGTPAGSVAGVTLQLRLDGGAWAGVNASATLWRLPDLPDGDHVVDVRAVWQGTVDPSPAGVAWTVDTTPPSCALVVAAHPTYVAAASEAAAHVLVRHGTADAVNSTAWEAAPPGGVLAVAPPPSAAGLEYVVQCRGVDAAGNVGPPAAVATHLDAGVCAPAPPAVTFTSTAVSDGWRVVTWAAPGATAFDVSVNNGTWQRAAQPLWRQAADEGRHMDVRVRAAVAASHCRHPHPPAHLRVWEPVAARPSVTLDAAPAVTTPALFATFQLRAASEPAPTVYQYRLDGEAAWVPCSRTLHVGALTPGTHTAEFRAAAAAGASGEWGDPVQWVWTIGSADDSRLLLSALPAGPVQLTLRAVDGMGNREAVPHVVAWEVDVTPPTTAAHLLSPALTRTPAAVVNASCGGEAHACSFCYAVAPASASVPVGAATCGPNATMHAAVGGGDGTYAVRVWAVDAAGLADAVGVTLHFTVDATPPNTTLAAVQALTAVDGRGLWWPRPALNLTLGCSDASAAVAHATVNGGAAAVWHPGVVAVSALADGDVVVRAACTDAAGNTDATPAVVAFAVDTQPPDTQLVARPPAVVNTSAVTFTVTGTDASGVVQRLWGGWNHSSALAPSASGVFTLHAAADGVHTFVAVAEDALGSTDPTPVTASVRVDTTPPNTTVHAPTRPWASRVVPLAVTVSEPVSATHVAVCRGSAPCPDAVPVALQDAAATAATVNVTVPDDGVFTAVAWSVDAALNAEAARRAAATFAVDTAPPEVAWAAVPQPVTRAATTQACVQVVDSTTTHVTAVAAVRRPGMEDVEVPVAVPPSGCMQFNHTSAPLLPPVAVTLRVVATDAAGLSSAPDAPGAASWVVDTQPPVLHVAQALTASCPALPSQPEVAVCGGPGTVPSVTVTCDATVLPGADAACTVTHRVELVEPVGGGGAGCARRLLPASDGVVPQGVPFSVPGVAAAAADATDGMYEVWMAAEDVAGNTAAARVVATVHVDTRAPPAPTLLEAPTDTTSRVAVFRMRVVDDTSPGPLTLYYALDDPTLAAPVAVAQQPAGADNSGTVTLTLADMAPGVHTLSVWARDVAGNQAPATAAFAQWTVVDSAPGVEFGAVPARVSGDASPRVRARAVWPDGRVEPAAALQYRLDAGDWVPVACSGGDAGNATAATGNATAGWCTLTLHLPSPATYTLSVRAVRAALPGDAATHTWAFQECGDGEVAEVGDNHAITCLPCPRGANCAGALTTAAQLVVQPGFWGAPDGGSFYACPIPGACLPGGATVDPATNATVFRPSACAAGYTGLLCAQCDTGHFKQFGECQRCAGGSDGANIAVVAGALLALAVVLAVVYRLRALLPVQPLKVSITMLQLVAAASASYDVPWPAAFAELAHALRAFLADIVSVTRAQCAAPMDALQATALTFVAFKAGLLVLVLAPTAHARCVVARRARRHAAASVPVLAGRRRNGIRVPGVRVTHRRTSVLATVRQAAAARASTLPWAALFRATFFYLFVTYAAVSLRVMQVFDCLEVNGRHYLRADLRVRCYTATWDAYAAYAAVMGVVVTAGFPAAIVAVLVAHRGRLHTPAVQRVWGFLYTAFGTHAAWWEVEELLRKLLLTAVVVLLDPSTPLSVTLGVVVSAAAHVLHAMYKPWRHDHFATYVAQHLSLGVTSYVLLMGLLLKVDGVAPGTPAFRFVEVTLVAFVSGTLAVLAAVVVAVMVARYRALRRARVVAADRGKDALVTKVRLDATAAAAVVAAADGGRQTAAVVAATTSGSPTSGSRSSSSSSKAIPVRLPPHHVAVGLTQNPLHTLRWKKNRMLANLRHVRRLGRLTDAHPLPPADGDG